LLERARPTLLVDGDDVRALAGEPVEEDEALVARRSGTGGAPKLVVFDRHAVDAAVASSALALDATPHDRWLSVLPLAHVGGLLVLLPAVLLDAPGKVPPPS